MREITEIQVILALEVTSKGKEYLDNSMDIRPVKVLPSNYLGDESGYEIILVDTGLIKTYELMDVIEMAFSMLDDKMEKAFQTVANSDYGECAMAITAYSKDVFPAMVITEEYIKKIADLNMSVDMDVH